MAGVDHVLSMSGVTLVRGGSAVLRDVDWCVRQGERWVVLGPNGAGKSSLLKLASTYELPSRGSVRVLGDLVGRTYLPDLRKRVGYSGAPLRELLDADLTVVAAIATGRHAVLRRWREPYTGQDLSRARSLAQRVGLGGLAERRVGGLSEGEVQRLHIARSLMPRPELLLLDEPSANLDVGGREQLVATLDALAGDDSLRAVVLVTHHVEEIPPGFTHALLLAGGDMAASGPIEKVLLSTTLSTVFGLPLRVVRRDGRWAAYAEPGRQVAVP